MDSTSTEDDLMGSWYLHDRNKDESIKHGSLNRRDLRPGLEAVFEPGGTFLDFRSKLPPNGKYQNGESYPITADFT